MNATVLAQALCYFVEFIHLKNLLLTNRNANEMTLKILSNLYNKCTNAAP